MPISSSTPLWRETLIHAAGWPQNFKLLDYASYKIGVVPESKILEPAAKRFLSDLCEEHVRNDSDILEIGAFEIDSTGTSYLGKFLPDHLRDRLTYSDQPSHCLKELAKGAMHYIPLDIVKPLDPSRFSTTDIVILNCVWDTLARDKLLDAATAIKNLLRPGGKVIILSDKAISTAPFFDQFRDTEVAIPLFHEPTMLMTGYAVASAEELKRNATTHELSSEHAQCLADFLKLTPSQRNYALFKDHNENREFSSSFLKNLLKGVEAKLYPLDEDYYNSAREALTQAGLKVLTCERKKATVIKDHPGNSISTAFNCFVNDARGDVGMGNLGVIATGKAQLTYQFRIIIAEKV